MNRVLKRPMFRIGGSAGTGITSGLDQPRKQFQQGTNPYARPLAPGTIPGFLTSFGLDLLSRPPQGNIFQTAATAAKGPFETFQMANLRRAETEAEKAFKEKLAEDERKFLTQEREETEKFEESQLEKRLKVEREKIGAKDTMTVEQLALTYLDDYDGDINKATNKAKFFLDIRPELSKSVGETQIGGTIEIDLQNVKQTKSFARQNKNKVGKIFFDINTGTLKKLVKDPETGQLGFIDFNLTGDITPDIEGTTLPGQENTDIPTEDVRKKPDFTFFTDEQKEKFKDLGEEFSGDFYSGAG